MPALGVLLAALLSAVAAISGCTPDHVVSPNIVLVVLDTVRADRLRCSGDDRASTPRIDELCRRGIYFENASSTSSWTLPSHASVFTGLYPIRHGATQEHTFLDDSVATLAELLAANGYRTFAVSANPMVSIKSGLARGFDIFEETWRTRPERDRSEPGLHPNLRAIDEVLATRDRMRPFFLFTNFIEAHGPNDPPEPYRSLAMADEPAPGAVARARRLTATTFYLDPGAVPADDLALLRRLYDGEIAQLDTLVGEVMDRLDADGALRDSLVIVTSDHGENFGDHGHFRHIFSLYESTVHVPLVVIPPGGAQAGTVRSDPVALVDLFATILAAAGVALPASGVDGRDLLAETSRDDAPPVVAEYYYPIQALGLFEPDAPEEHRDRLGGYLRRLRSIEYDGLRLIRSSTGDVELYDRAADPHEQVDVAGDPRYATRERALRQRLDAFVAEAGGPRALPDAARRLAAPAGSFEGLDDESRELLRELGYLPP